jgi:DNA-directed RNA polymerase subunit RPC12/RpoP
MTMETEIYAETGMTEMPEACKEGRYTTNSNLVHYCEFEKSCKWLMKEVEHKNCPLRRGILAQPDGDNAVRIGGVRFEAVRAAKRIPAIPSEYKCSSCGNCGKEYKFLDRYMHCPNCGAKFEVQK